MKRKRIKSFNPHWGYKATFLGLGAVAAIAHLIIFRTIPDLSSIPLPALLAMLTSDAFILWFGIVFSTQSRVTVYDDGLELERGNSKVFTPWENISHFGVKHGGKNQHRGLWLHEAVQPEAQGIEKLLFGWKTNFISLAQYVPLPKKHIFSYEIDTEKLLDTEFGQAVYEFAPHLFEGKPKHRSVDYYNRLADKLNTKAVPADADEETYNEAQEN